MPRRPTPLWNGEYYHLYNRGNNRELVFFGREDYLAFLQRLRVYVVPQTEIIAYCLMPTHYHLAVYIKPTSEVPWTSEVGAISRTMMRLSVSYTKWMNARYERVGSLFQGAFQAKHVDRDHYLVYLSAYIHRNPVDAGLVKRAEEWEFSSYQDYVGIRHGTLPTPQPILSHFPSSEAYRDYVEAWTLPEDEAIALLLLD